MPIIEHIQHYTGYSSYPFHSHLSCEMIFVTENELKMEDSGGIHIACKGDLCIVPAGVSHGTKACPSSYGRWLIHINPWSLSRTYNSPYISAAIIGLSLKQITVFKSVENGAELIEHIYRNYNSDSPMAQDKIAAGVIYLLSTAIEQNPTLCTPISGAAQTVMQAQGYIQQNCAAEIDMNELAKRYYTDRYYLTHIFTKLIGMPPKKFQILCRLENAEKLIRKTNLNISDIAEQCGFYSLSDLTARFKERYGVTPRKYREQLKITPQN